MKPSRDALIDSVAQILAADVGPVSSSQLLSQAISTDPTQLDIPGGEDAGNSEQIRRRRQEIDLLMSAYGVQLIPRYADGYPALLRSTRTAPPLLFARGTASRLHDHAVAIVGSRRINARIREDTTHVARTLARAGATIVSGLALGTDTAAHRGALMSGEGRTIAVLPSGIAHPYPATNASLLDEIARVGVVVSQFLPWDSPVRESFLARNATISGLSSVSVVMAAHERSGTRNEINHAVSQDRIVLLWEPGVGRQVWADNLVTRRKARFVSFASEIRDAVEEARQT